MKSSLPAHSSSGQKTYAIINLSAYAAMITANCLSIFLPLNGKNQAQLSAQYPNLFTPAGFTFSVWSVIYTLLLGFIVYQFYVLFTNQNTNKTLILTLSPLFVGVCICNAGWLFAWHYEMTTLSVLIMLIHLWLLILIHDKLKLALLWRPVAPKIWIDIPFSIYLGWICVATIANVSAWLVSKDVMLSFFSEITWTIIMITAALLVGIFYIFTRRNYFVALTIAWALYGIISKRKETGADETQPIIIAAWIAIGILLFVILLNAFRKNSHDKETNMSA